MAEEKKVSEKIQKIVEEIEKLNVLELSELASYLEDKFGVQAMAVPAAAAPATGGAEAAQQEEKSTYTVVLQDVGSNKLAVIKALREVLPNLGLMEAKKLAESAPKEILTDVKKEQAEEAKKKLEAAGAKVELK
ncbi:MAG TPA: 50S ribosomal protein L7/L12 [Armatimonadetes bacterium]|nr:50S ribosomal protein L7/L12 [Armatimonadota bacterium]